MYTQLYHVGKSSEALDLTSISWMYIFIKCIILVNMLSGLIVLIVSAIVKFNDKDVFNWSLLLITILGLIININYIFIILHPSWLIGCVHVNKNMPLKDNDKKSVMASGTFVNHYELVNSATGVNSQWCDSLSQSAQ